MSGADLTRWNRASLPRFRYIGANAATHLEALRVELAARFPDPLWDVLRIQSPPVNETALERAVRMIEQYDAARRDWAWETTRTFARALHILTEHLDAFANEGYLRTATQLSTMHLLAAMIAYTPAPAASASTPIALSAKPDVAKATVKRGFAVKSLPPGQPPVIFETLSDIDIAAALNEMRPNGWNVNAGHLTNALIYSPTAGAELWTLSKSIEVSAGGLVLLASKSADDAIAEPFAAAKIGAVAGLALSIEKIGTPAETPASFTYDTARLHAAPAQILVPTINGSGAVRVPAGHGFVAGDLIAWSGVSGTKFAQVLEADDHALRLQTVDGAALPAAGVVLFRALQISEAQFRANNLEWRIPTEPVRSGAFAMIYATTTGQLTAAAGLAFDQPASTKDPNVLAGYDRVIQGVPAGVKTVWFADPGRDKVVATIAAPPPAGTLDFKGAPTGLSSGDVLVLETDGGYIPNLIDRIEKGAGFYRIVLHAAVGGTKIRAVHAAFAAVLRPAGAGINPTPISGSDLALDLADWPVPLNSSRAILLESAGGAFDPLLARVVDIDMQVTPKTITIDKVLPRDFTVEGAAPGTLVVTTGDLVIRANVVEAGHGETKPVKVLGSGDASAINQSFTIDMPDVAQLRDPAMPGGIRADVTIQAGDEFYRQVASLRDSAPADPHFTVTPSETGALVLEFGDGRHGRRLPTGTNNVRATLRKGSGPTGNLAAGALTDVVKKHPFVAAFRQPIAASGGSEAEALDQIRLNAPGRLTAMDRAISVADYQRLAQRFAGVWHAVAKENLDLARSREGVTVAIVPAGGGSIGTLGPLGEEIRAYLVANGLPSVDVEVQPYAPLALEIAVRAHVDSTRYDPRDVEARVRAAVLAAFDLRLRAPGQPVYRSEVFRIVEAIEGVSNSFVNLFASVVPPNDLDWEHATRGDDGGIWAVYPKFGQVIYAQNQARITITTAEADI